MLPHEVEIRRNEDGTLDEVILRISQTVVFHLEQMAPDAWWIGLRVPGGASYMLNLWSSRKIHARIEED